ncbi:hypothetical protein P691DRAFT_778307 [Macrolepiota fuliginosa MF-IS2]|uniref:CFEM domain-containing protein n=1 Tax=Macrolepiota fuliginosa MF-IS2 TaxID=1400762 RepID=A0A9P5X5E1_9AGAR|nr:hypothetical protein P691DRAFT_778307 [Macrolepiota fuliginosa MF-IS2]
MFSQIAVAALWSLVAFRAALAQNTNGLPACGATCITEVAKQKGCVLATPTCLCPSQLDIHNCILRTCKIEDQSASNTVIDSICSASVPSPSITPSPPILTPTLPTTSLGPTFNPPITIVTITTQPSLTPSSSLTPNSLTSTTLSTSSTTSTSTTPTTTSSPVIISITPIPLSTSEAPQTVVVFSTQFAPPAPPTGNSGASPLHNSAAALSITIFISGILAILIT